MATTAEQATYGAQKGKNWAAPGDAAFGQAGNMGQTEYDAYGGPKPPAAPGQAGGFDAPSGAPPAAPAPTPQNTGQALTGAATVGAQPGQGAQATTAGAFQQAMLNALAPGQVNAQNAAIAPAIQANQLAEQRGFENNRALAAEMGAQNGTNNSGGMNTTMLGLAQDRTAREGQFSANAVQGLQDKQDSAKMMMAQLAAGMMQNTDAQGLQQSGQNMQNALGQGDLALRGQLGKGQLSLGLLQALMQNEQFGQSESGTNARFSANMNQEAIWRGLGLL